MLCGTISPLPGEVQGFLCDLNLVFLHIYKILPWNVPEPSPDGLKDEPGNGENPVLVTAMQELPLRKWRVLKNMERKILINIDKKKLYNYYDK